MRAAMRLYLEHCPTDLPVREPLRLALRCGYAPHGKFLPPTYSANNKAEIVVGELQSPAQPWSVPLVMN